MEQWMTTVLIIGFIIMAFFWFAAWYGGRIQKKQQIKPQTEPDKVDFVFNHWDKDSEDNDDDLMYDSNGKRIR